MGFLAYPPLQSNNIYVTGYFYFVELRLVKLYLVTGNLPVWDLEFRGQ